MSDQPRHDQRFSGNMAPNQSGTPDYRNPRSHQQSTGRPAVTNTQQLHPSPHAFDASSWANPAFAAQYYGYDQPVPENRFSHNTSYPHQNVQSFAPVSFGNPSYQAQFDPASQMLQNWSRYGSGMQYAGQQYPMQQTSTQQMPFQQFQHTPFEQTAFQQAPVQQAQGQPQPDIKQDPKAIDMYSGHYDDSHDMNSGDYAAEDDPSAQLMAELTQNILESSVSPTQALEASESKYEWDNSTANPTAFESNNSTIYAPQNGHGAEYQTFRSFEYENPISDAEQAQQDELGQQVDQVVASLSDEDMQEEQAVVMRRPDYAARTPVHQRYDIEVADEEREYSVPADTPEQYEDFTAGHVEVPSDEVDNDVDENDVDEDDVDEDDVDEDDTMQVDEHQIGENHDQYEVSDDGVEQVESDEDTMEADVAEDEDADLDASDAEIFSAQDAHDSGVEDSPQVKFEGYMLAESPLKTIKKTIASKADKELHHKAWKLQPHHLPAHRYWIAILMHTVQSQKAKVEKDFIWLKGSKINTIETMWNKYREVTTEEQHQILFCGRAPDFTDTVEELDSFGDQLVVFRAAKKEVVVVD